MILKTKKVVNFVKIAMSLFSEEDEEDETRNKIEKEEKIRAEVKSEIEKEKNKSSLGAGCLGFLVFVIIVYFIMFNPFTSQEKETQPSIINLNASVRFTGTQFIIETMIILIG